MRILENRVKIDVRFLTRFLLCESCEDKRSHEAKKMHTWASSVIKKFKIKSKIKKIMAYPIQV